MRKYFIKTKKKEGCASVFTRIRKRSVNIDMVVCTHISVRIEKFNKSNFYNTPVGKDVLAKEMSVDKVIDDMIDKGIYNKEKIEEAINTVIFAPEREALRQKEKEEKEAKEREERAKKSNVILYLENFYKSIKSGERLQDGRHKREKYADNTVKVWHTFLLILKDFYKRHPFTWNDIDQQLTDKFLLFLERRGYLKKTVNKYFVCFRAIVAYAYKDKYHANTIAITRGSMAKKTVRKADKKAEIYLTKDELNGLYEMNLTGLKDRVRDLFLIGCYTGQRYSDIVSLSPTSFTTTARGTRIIKITQKKTGNEVCIPVLSDRLESICKKYDYKMPEESDVIINRYIKNILKELSDEIPSLAVKVRTQLTQKERSDESKGVKEYERDSDGFPVKPRYELASVHTGRRTCITLLYLSKMFDLPQMMSVSGHKSTGTFLEYVKLSGEEFADDVAKTYAENQQSSNESLF